MSTCPQCKLAVDRLWRGVCYQCHMSRCNYLSVAGYNHTKDAWQLKELVDKCTTTWDKWTMIGYTPTFGDDLFVPNEYMVYPWKELS